MTTLLWFNRVLSFADILIHGSRWLASPRLMDREDGVFLSFLGCCLSRRKIHTIKRGSAWNGGWNHLTCTHYAPTISILRHGAVLVWWLRPQWFSTTVVPCSAR